MFGDIHRTEYLPLHITLIDVLTEGGQPIGYRIRPPKRLRRTPITVRTLPVRERVMSFEHRVAWLEWFVARSQETGKTAPVLREDVLVKTGATARS